MEKAKNTLRTAHFHSDSETLHDFITTGTDDMHADNALIRPNADKLVHCRLFMFLINHGEIKGTEGRFIYNKKSSNYQLDCLLQDRTWKIITDFNSVVTILSTRLRFR